MSDAHASRMEAGRRKQREREDRRRAETEKKAALESGWADPLDTPGGGWEMQTALDPPKDDNGLGALAR